jgi:hypothetical protein
MRTRNATTRRAERGTTLLEAIISLAILLVGMLGLVQLQIYGITANGGARAHTNAVQLARELAAGLARLPTTDVRLAGSAGTTGEPPAVFGRILQGDGSGASDAHVYSDAAPIPGTRLDSAIEKDGASTTTPIYVRRWTVWDSFSSGSGVATKVIAVSVIYRERGSPNPREVVLYTQVANRGLFGANISAYN